MLLNMSELCTRILFTDQLMLFLTSFKNRRLEMPAILHLVAIMYVRPHGTYKSWSTANLLNQ